MVWGVPEVWRQCYSLSVNSGKIVAGRVDEYKCNHKEGFQEMLRRIWGWNNLPRTKRLLKECKSLQSQSSLTLIMKTPSTASQCWHFNVFTYEERNCVPLLPGEQQSTHNIATGSRRTMHTWQLIQDHTAFRKRLSSPYRFLTSEKGKKKCLTFNI